MNLSINQITEPSNTLGLFDSSGHVDLEKTINFLEISKTALASAFGISPDKLRLDRMTDVVREKIAQIAYALELVAVSFKGNLNKTKFWINTPNPNFGGASPRSLIIRGRYNKVISFIEAAHRLSK